MVTWLLCVSVPGPAFPLSDGVLCVLASLEGIPHGSSPRKHELVFSDGGQLLSPCYIERARIKNGSDSGNKETGMSRRHQEGTAQHCSTDTWIRPRS
jgi:hypothetical protein